MLLSHISSSRRSTLKHQCILLICPHTRRIWSYSCIQCTQLNTRGFTLLCIHLGILGYSHEGHAGLIVCKIIKQLSSKFHRLHMCCHRINKYFYLVCLLGQQEKNIYACLPATITNTLKKVFDKSTYFARVQMLPRLVLIHGAACDADSQRSESRFECAWDVFTGYVGAAVRP